MKSMDNQRELTVAKRNDMLQNARYNLTVQEQRVILYSVAQIKPDDTHLQEYEFELKDFYRLCGIEDQSYTRLKRMLKALSDKSWIMPIRDDKGKVWDTVVRWFTTVSTNKESGKVRIEFHKHMMPYLIELSKQYTLTGQRYSQYKLKYILAMQSKFSPRLYELLKSYENNTSWFFSPEELHKLLSDSDKDGNPIIPKSWYNFAEFRRRVIDPAVTEINKYTDLKIVYKEEKKGNKTIKVHFLLLNKTNGQLLEADQAIREELDGQIDIYEVLGEEPDPFELAKQEQLAAVRAEQEAEAAAERRRQASMQGIKAWIDPEKTE